MCVSSMLSVLDCTSLTSQTDFRFSPYETNKTAFSLILMSCRCCSQKNILISSVDSWLHSLSFSHLSVLSWKKPVSYSDLLLTQIAFSVMYLIMFVIKHICSIPQYLHSSHLNCNLNVFFLIQSRLKQQKLYEGPHLPTEDDLRVRRSFTFIYNIQVLHLGTVTI